ncbi:MAG: hypothetical protein ACI9MR_001480 [Myxococcota bacterium]|jgi:hypothetical protein
MKMTQTSRMLALLAATSLAFTAVACGGKQTSESARVDDNPLRASRAASEFPAFGDPAKVTLIEAGSGEKSEIRWIGKVGEGTTMKITMDMNMSMQAAQMGNQDIDMKMMMDVDGKITELKDDGHMVITLTVKDADLNMPQLAAMGDADAAKKVFRDMMKSMIIETTIDPRGVTSTTEIKGLDPSMAQMMGGMDQSFDQMGIPFPAAAIGVGAKWEALAQQEANGIKVRVATTYELTKFDGTNGTLKMTVQQFADPQKMNVGMMSGDLKKLRSNGSGEMQFNVNEPMMGAIDMKLKMDMDMKATAMGETLDLVSKTSIAMKVTK